MTRLISSLQALAFAILLLLPALVWIISGTADPYEGRPQTTFPAPGKLIAPDPDAREVFGDALFERSDVRRWALAGKSVITRHIFGFTDSNDVVSGGDGYLFYRPSLEEWQCEEHDKLTSQLQGFLTLVEIADAADANIGFVIAPNKASVVASALTGRAGIYRECYLRFQQFLEQTLDRVNSPRVIYQQPLLADPGNTPTYLKTDTHFNAKGETLATQQAFQNLPFSSEFTIDVRAAESSIDLETDLNRLVLYPGVETDSRFSMSSVHTYPEKLVLVYDSFYERVTRSLKMMIPGIETIPYGDFSNQTFDPDAHIIVTSVERFFLPRSVRGQYMGWGGGIGDWILDRSATAATHCDWSGAIDLMNQDGSGATASDAGDRPSISANSRYVLITVPAAWKGDKICLSASFSGESANARLYFPKIASWQLGSYVNSRSVAYDRARNGENLSLVIPSVYAGTTLRLQPTSESVSVTSLSLSTAR